MRIRISKKGLVAAGVAGAILVCGAVFRMVDNKSVKHINTAAVGDDHSPISDAIKDALDGNNSVDSKTAAAVVAGASTIEIAKEEVKEEVKEAEAQEVKEEAPAQTQEAAQTSAPAKKQSATTQSTNKSAGTQKAEVKEEIINEEIPVVNTEPPAKEAKSKTAQVEEYVGSDADAEKAIQAQQAEKEAKTVENFGGDQFVESLD